MDSVYPQLSLPELSRCTLIGDVHGCVDELDALLSRLREEAQPTGTPAEPLIFLGDLVNKGPDTVGVLERVSELVDAGQAHVVRGNHDDMLSRVWRGERRANPGGDTARTVARYVGLAETDRFRWGNWLSELPLRINFDADRAIAVHGGLPTEFEAPAPKVAARTALWGSAGEALPGVPHFRLNWALSYDRTTPVYLGHVPLAEVWRRGPVTSLDTGCVYGGKLTAIRYPGGEVIAVPALRAWVDKPGW